MFPHCRWPCWYTPIITNSHLLELYAIVRHSIIILPYLIMNHHWYQTWIIQHFPFSLAIDRPSCWPFWSLVFLTINHSWILIVMVFSHQVDTTSPGSWLENRHRTPAPNRPGFSNPQFTVRRFCPSKGFLPPRVVSPRFDRLVVEKHGEWWSLTLVMVNSSQLVVD